MYLIAAGSAVSLFTFRNIADFFRTNVLSAGGFTGTIRVDYNQGIGKNASSIIEVSYKINKGANKGGNKANVIYSDGGTLPIKTFNTEMLASKTINGITWVVAIHEVLEVSLLSLFLIKAGLQTLVVQ
jgi:hypothetical protein